MLHLPILRWGQPYTSLETDRIVHFETGEPVATGAAALAVHALYEDEIPRPDGEAHLGVSRPAFGGVRLDK